MKKLYIIKTGSTYSSNLETLGDFDDWIKSALGRVNVPVEVVDMAGGGTLPSLQDCSGVILSGSHAMVTDNLEWSLRIESWIPLLVAVGVPLLGICYGHQLLGRAMGGKAGYHPLGREIGTVDINLTPQACDDPLFQAIPVFFAAHATHAQSVLSLPPGALLLAGNSHDPHHAFRVGSCAWGVQFHPEYTVAIMQAYITAQAENLRKSKRNPDVILSGVTDTPFARKILTNFAALIDT
jgi:GMP synthase (glutamine-hydrolysing)